MEDKCCAAKIFMRTNCNPPFGHGGLFLSLVIRYLIQKDLLTLLLFTFPSRWNSGDLELFVCIPKVPWDLHPSLHKIPSDHGHPDTGLGRRYVPAGQRVHSGESKNNQMVHGHKADCIEMNKWKYFFNWMPVWQLSLIKTLKVYLCILCEFFYWWFAWS